MACTFNKGRLEPSPFISLESIPLKLQNLDHLQYLMVFNLFTAIFVDDQTLVCVN